MPNENKVQNPESPVAKTPQMNDGILLMICLQQKSTFVTPLSVALHEMSNHALFQDIFSSFERKSGDAA